MRRHDARDGNGLIKGVARRDSPRGWRLHAAASLIVDARVAQRFNAYAALAYPFEVGGLLRVTSDRRGEWRVVDLAVLEQEATEGSFELDPVAVAQHARSLEAAGRGAELSEWRGVVHSHPSMQPFMSALDRLTLVALAGGGFAFSLICGAHANPRHNVWAAYYAQHAPLPLVADAPLRVRGGSLAGTELLEADEHDRIAHDLAVVLHRPPPLMQRGWRLATESTDRPARSATAAAAPGLDVDRLAAGERALALAVVEERRRAQADARQLGLLIGLAWRLRNGRRLPPQDVELLAGEVAAARDGGFELLSRSLLAELNGARTGGNVVPPPIAGRAPEVRVDYRRQSALLDPPTAAATHVTVCGAGTAGSHAALELCRMGIGTLTLYDDDVVSPENLPSQTYELGDVGEPKVAALSGLLHACSDHVQAHGYASRLVGGEPLPGRVVILAVDSMLARRAILERSLAGRANHELVLDVRIGSTVLQLLAIDPCSMREVTCWREEFWFPDEQAEELPCGTRAASFVGALAGALIASHVRLHLVGVRPPFFIQHDLSSYVQIVCVTAPGAGRVRTM